MLTVTVVTVPSVAVAVAPRSPAPGVTTTFFANVTGGTGPYTFSWRFGDGEGSSFADPQHAFLAAGSYTAQVWVNDSAGSSVHGSISLTVGTVSSAGSVFGVPWWFLVGVVSLIVVGAAGTVLLLRRGRT